VKDEAQQPQTVEGVAAIPAAFGDIAAETAQDVMQLPQATADAAAFPGKRILLPLLLAQFLNSYDSSSMNVAISNIVSDLGTTVTGVQTAISLYTLVMAAGMIIGSKLADIWGRKRMFTIGVIAYGTGALITAMAPSITVMVLGWSLLEGIGSCLMIPPIYILATVNFKDLKARAAAFGAISAAAGLGGMLGPLIGGIITTAVSWRLSFAIEVVVVVIIVLMRGRIVDPGLEGPKPKLDVVGAILSALGMTALVAGALLAGQYGWLSARKDFVVAGRVLIQEGGISPVWIFFAVGIVTLLGFGGWARYRERHGKEPLVPTRVLLNRVAVPGLVTQSAQWFLQLGIIFVVSVFLQVTFEFNAIQTGFALTPAILGLLFFSRRAGQLTKKYPSRAIMQAGFVAIELGALALLLLVDANAGVARFIPGLLLIGSGIGLVMPASVNMVQSAASEEDQGAISGVSRSASNLGSSLGTAVAGAVLVSALIVGVNGLTTESTVLAPGDKVAIATALEDDVSAVSDTKVRMVLEGQPAAVVEEVVRINADARNRGMALALLLVGAVGLLGLVATLFLPGRPANGVDGQPPTSGEAPAT
jgi:MFS family permease